jgi:tetratricopeptide (TPR) repeat protein
MVEPEQDRWIGETVNETLETVLHDLAEALKNKDSEAISRFLAPGFRATPVLPIESEAVPTLGGVELFRDLYSRDLSLSAADFPALLLEWVSPFRSYDELKFKMVGISVEEEDGHPLVASSRILYEMAGEGAQDEALTRRGRWQVEWTRVDGNWKMKTLQAVGSTHGRAEGSFFVDVSALAFVEVPSYWEQMRRGLNDFRTRMDAASGIGVYGHNGVAVGDIDGDGHEDLFVAQPSGLPNRLYRNQGDGTFADISRESGLDLLDRTSMGLFADFDNDGDQDLFVVIQNRSPLLFANDGQGGFELSRRSRFERKDQVRATFTSASLSDYDNDGYLDLYVCSYRYFDNEGEDTQLALPYPYHDATNGPPNVLFRNRGDGTFDDVTEEAGLNEGNDRYSFASSWGDFNQDGLSDLYVANDFGRNNLYRNLGNGKFREVSGQAGVEDIGAGMSVAWSDYDLDGRDDLYEQGWDAINRLIRQDGSWSGRERNCLYLNNGDGTFVDASGVSGVDFRQDGRAFAVLDIDGDGDQDFALKSRNRPQLRLLRNDLANGRRAVRFALEGRSSNRDAVGARVEVHTEKGLRQKSVRAASGYLSQSSLILHFGLEGLGEVEKVIVRWPSGQVQTLEQIPDDHLIRVVEGEGLQAEPFRPSVTTPVPPRDEPPEVSAPGTWLLDPIPAPDFTLKDLDGKTQRLVDARGQKVLLNFWATWCAPCRAELADFQQLFDELRNAGVRLIAISVDEPPAEKVVRDFSEDLGLDLPLVLASPDLVGVYNVVARNLLDRVADLAIPTSFLLDEQGDIVKVYRGAVAVEEIVKDAGRIPRSREARIAAGLPFDGTNLGSKFLRNQFQLANEFAERGYPPQAEGFYERAAERSPTIAKIHFNLGTLRARQGRLDEAIAAFNTALASDPEYADAHSNLGSVYASQGKLSEASASLARAIALDPSLADAHNNLGNVYAASGKISQAEEAYRRAFHERLDFPEAHNNLGVLQARTGNLETAIASFEQAVALRPDYAEALLNLGNALAQVGRGPDAVEYLQRGFDLAPSPRACISLVLASVEAGDRNGAKQALGKGLRRWPDHQELQRLALDLGVPAAQ